MVERIVLDPDIFVRTVHHRCGSGLERETPAEKSQLLLGIGRKQLVDHVECRVALQTGVPHPIDCRLSGQPMGDAQGVEAMPHHSHAESLQAPDCEMTVVWGRGSAL